MRVPCRVLAILLVVALCGACAVVPLPSQQEYEPPNGKGRVVVVVSGHSGPGNYADYAKALAEQGYYAVLVDGNDVWVGRPGSEALLKGVVMRAQQSPHALPGKVAVVGFSRGGASSLTFAARMQEVVSAVVVSFPSTRHITDVDSFVAQITVPTLMFAGGHDTYKNCCRIETARRLAGAAKVTGGRALLEIVEYPEAHHGWTVRSSRAYREDYTADGFRRTLDHLRRHSGD